MATTPPTSTAAPRTPAPTSARSIVILLLFWAIIYLPGLTHPPLLDDADSVHAEAAREMTVMHQYVTLYINGMRYLEKPPLPYWLIAGLDNVSDWFGAPVAEWQARLPLYLSVLGLMLACYFIGRRWYGENGGLYAGVIAGVAVGTYLFSRIVIPDIAVAMFYILSVHFFLRTFEGDRPSRTACWGLAIVTALNVLTKGLIGIIFPCGVFFFYYLISGDWKHLLRLRWLSSLAIFLAIATPWHVLAGMRNPPAGAAKGFYWYYFVNEHFLRYVGKRIPKDYDTVPFLIFWGLMLVWLLPWTIFLPQALKEIPVHLRELRTRMTPRLRANLAFGISAFMVLVFFSFSTRQEYYAIPALPGFSLLTASWLQRETDGEADPKSGRRSVLVLLIVGVLVFVATMAVLASSKAPPPGTDIADLLAQHPSEYALSMGHFLDLTPQAMGAFRVPLLGTGLAFLLGPLAAWWLRRRGRIKASNFALVVMITVFLWCAQAGFAIFNPVLSSKNLADAIARVWKPGDIIVIDGQYEDGSTLNFYTHHQVRILATKENNGFGGDLSIESAFPDSPKIFDDEAAFLREWNGEQRVFLWVDDRHPTPVLAGQKVYTIAQSGGKRIVSNRPL